MPYNDFILEFNVVSTCRGCFINTEEQVFFESDTQLCSSSLPLEITTRNGEILQDFEMTCGQCSLKGRAGKVIISRTNDLGGSSVRIYPMPYSKLSAAESAVIAKIPQYLKLQNDAKVLGERTGDDCSICMEKLSVIDKDNGAPIITNCQHIFHRDCLGAARAVKNECPLCRETIKTTVEVALDVLHATQRFEQSAKDAALARELAGEEQKQLKEDEELARRLHEELNL